MKSNIYKLQSIYFFRFLGDALFYPFLSLLFSSLGFTSWRLGLLQAAIPVMGIFGNLLFGRLSSTTRRNLLLAKIMLVIEGAFIMSMGFMTDFIFVLLFTAGVSLLNSSYFSISDGISATICNETHDNFDKIRIFGSIAYLFSTFFGGYLIDTISFKYTFIIASALYLVAFILWMTLKKVDNELEKDHVKIHFHDLLKRKEVLFYILFYLLAIGASNVSDTFLPLYTETLGFSKTQYGQLYSLMIVFEILTMLAIIKFAKPKHYKSLLIITSVLITLRNLLYALPLPPYFIYPIAATRGIAWGLLLGVHINYCHYLVKKEELSKFITLITAILCSFNAVMNFLGPLIYENTSFSVLFSILSVLALLGTIVISLTGLKIDDNEMKS